MIAGEALGTPVGGCTPAGQRHDTDENLSDKDADLGDGLGRGRWHDQIGAGDDV